MQLSEIYSESFGRLLCDGDFDLFGMLNTQKEGKRIFSYINHEKYQEELHNQKLSCIVCTEVLLEKLPCHIKGIIVAENPGEVFWKMHSRQKIEKVQTLIGNNCQISRQAYIAKNNVVIGNNVVIEEFVSIKEGTRIGDNCIIRAGSIIGGEGFQLQGRYDNTYSVVKHLGSVIIGNDVELQQSVCVDKAIFSWDSTVIGDGTKIDNLVHVGHAVKIGKNCEITAGIIFAGSVKTGDNIWIGPNATIRNNILIEKNANISLGSVVTKNVEQNQKVSGNFAIVHDKFMENLRHSIKEY